MGILSIVIFGLIGFSLFRTFETKFLIENKSIRIFRVTFLKYETKHIYFNEIKEIKLIPTWKVLPFIFIPYICYGARWWNNETIFIRVKKGIVKIILLSPPNSSDFLAKVRLEMYK